MEGPSRNNKELLEKLEAKISELLHEFNKFNLAGYMELLNNPRRFLWVNFVGGLARGFGVALGATILAALVIYALRQITLLNLPLIGDFIAEIVRIVQDRI